VLGPFLAVIDKTLEVGRRAPFEGAPPQPVGPSSASVTSAHGGCSSQVRTAVGQVGGDLGQARTTKFTKVSRLVKESHFETAHRRRPEALAFGTTGSDAIASSTPR
jgi:hypothetical protein